MEAGLAHVGAEIVWLPDNPVLDTRLAGHADLSVFFPDDTTAVVAEGMYSYFVKYLTKREYTVILSAPQGKRYPSDAGLCVCRTGRYIIYNSKTTDPNLLPRLHGILIDVPQGYTKCSVCVVNHEAIITADDVIASRAASDGMDVLHIEPGHILLEGFDTGFIGGASFLLNDTTLAFTGSLDAHPDKARIKAFLQKHGVEPYFVTDDPIFDIGGAVSLP